MKVTYFQRLQRVIEQVNDLPRITSSSIAAEAAQQLFDKYEIGVREEAIALYLNHNLVPVATAQISKGSATSTILAPQLILTHALLSGATTFVLYHNHPSGHIYPSNADLKITKKILEAGKLMDIKLMDHLIIHPEFETYYSFADEGHL